MITMTTCCEGEGQCQRIKLLETLLLQVLRDAIAQGVLIEWWGVISYALDIANESESYGEGGDADE